MKSLSSRIWNFKFSAISVWFVFLLVFVVVFFFTAMLGIDVSMIVRNQSCTDFCGIGVLASAAYILLFSIPVIIVFSVWKPALNLILLPVVFFGIIGFQFYKDFEIDRKREAHVEDQKKTATSKKVFDYKEIINQRFSTFSFEIPTDWEMIDVGSQKQSFGSAYFLNRSDYLSTNNFILQDIPEETGKQVCSLRFGVRGKLTQQGLDNIKKVNGETVNNIFLTEQGLSGRYFKSNETHHWDFVVTNQEGTHVVDLEYYISEIEEVNDYCVPIYNHVVETLMLT